MYAPNEKYDALGARNTFEEQIKVQAVQHTAHLEHLTKITASRHLLDSLRILHEKTAFDKISTPAERAASPGTRGNLHVVCIDTATWSYGFSRHRLLEQSS